VSDAGRNFSTKMTGPSKVVVLGQGYVGLPLAVRAVEAGYDVVGFDVDEARVKGLAAGESYVEDVDSVSLARILASGRYRPTSDESALEGFDVAVITVPTPLREGVPDLSFVEAAARLLGEYVGPGTIIVLESTTYPGTTRELVGTILEQRSGLTPGPQFHLGFSPERIDPGNQKWGIANTPKIVSGVDEASLRAIERFYSTLVETVVPVSDPAVAELAKLVENTFRHVNIALVNELAMFAADLGVDVWEAIDAASSKPFGFMRFLPGPGVGGHCLPIDPSYLSWQVRRQLGQTFRFVELANDINRHMPHYVVNRLVAALNRRQLSVKGSSILLLGLAYKRNSGDARESPAITVAERLMYLGAEVRAADPHVVEDHVLSEIIRVEATAEEAAIASAVVLLTDHDAFDLPMLARWSRYFLDTRHRVAGHNVEHL
jgi:UDP-N-acetyl-D-glucosamine dehydrogenase